MTGCLRDRLVQDLPLVAGEVGLERVDGAEDGSDAAVSESVPIGVGGAYGSVDSGGRVLPASVIIRSDCSAIWWMERETGGRRSGCLG